MIGPFVSEVTASALAPHFIPADEVRARFAQAMSNMYRAEVPQYGTLIDMVADINSTVLTDDALSALPRGTAETARLGVERHGAIRLGTARELNLMRRIFAVMGMVPVGYYDLSIAGVPVHSTAFRPVDAASLAFNPFRVFTSLLRLELIQDPKLRAVATDILQRREVFTQQAIRLTEKWEADGGLDSTDANEFVHEVLQTFRWHDAATVDRTTYERLHDAHRLVADVVCFKGPHINHLTPRTLDIDAAQAEMPRRGISAKEMVEGPPRRRVPILLRQTSFKALEETIRFAGDDAADGAHTARFGEIEQRGVALTRKGRALYDGLLEQVRSTGNGGGLSSDYETRLARAFKSFPDDLATLRREGLAFFRYNLREGAQALGTQDTAMDELIDQGMVDAVPIIYEDFLPVSAAGIFQSNLGGTEQRAYSAGAARQQFEEALGAIVQDEIALYEAEQSASIARIRARLHAGARA